MKLIQSLPWIRPTSNSSFHCMGVLPLLYGIQSEISLYYCVSVLSVFNPARRFKVTIVNEMKYKSYQFLLPFKYRVLLAISWSSEISNPLTSFRLYTRDDTKWWLHQVAVNDQDYGSCPIWLQPVSHDIKKTSWINLINNTFFQHAASVGIILLQPWINSTKPSESIVG